MKINEKRPVGRTTVRGGNTPAPEAAPSDVVGVDGRVIKDTTSIMGIPEPELTPNVRTAIMALMGEVDKMRKEMRSVRERLRSAEALADHDALLPLLNRRAFVRELSTAMSYAKRYDTPLSLLYIDIDGFKAINDTYGHAAGDAVLNDVARKIIAHIRESDIAGRLGGDEFGIILPHATEKSARAKASSISSVVSRDPVLLEGQSMGVTISIGAVMIGPDDEAEGALARADKAMYTAKRFSRQTH
jgi:diguanylate cyclase (GGDEF)-like protein